MDAEPRRNGEGSEADGRPSSLLSEVDLPRIGRATERSVDVPILFLKGSYMKEARGPSKREVRDFGLQPLPFPGPRVLAHLVNRRVVFSIVPYVEVNIHAAFRP